MITISNIYVLYVTVLAKTRIFVPKLKSILLPQLTDTLNIYPSPVHKMLNDNWSAFVKGILLTLQSHSWNSDTHGGHQLGSEDLGLLPLTMGPTIVSLANVWTSWLLMGCPKWSFLPPLTPPRPTSPHPAIHHAHPLYYQY